MSYTNTVTFTITDAKKIASKVATDLKRIQRFYGDPSEARIRMYEEEIVELMKAGFLYKVTYGFQRDDKWIEPTLVYTSKDLGSLAGDDDDPGTIRPGANIEGATFKSFLETNSAWSNLSSDEQKTFEDKLTINRTSGDAPSISGYLKSDKTYSSGGKSLERSVVKNY